MAIIGMDAAAPGCPDFRAFKSLLLTGKTGQTAPDFDLGTLNAALQASGLDEDVLGDLNFEERLLLLTIRRALTDAGIGVDNAIPQVVHIPAEMPNAVDICYERIKVCSGFHLNLENSMILKGTFVDALSRALNLLRDPACGQVVLCSRFTRPPSLTGGWGALVLSDQADVGACYAELVPSDSIPEMREMVESEMTIASSGGTGLTPEPLLEVMRCALSLNSQVHFGDCSPVADQETSSKEPACQPLRPWFPQHLAGERSCDLYLQDEDGIAFPLHLRKEYAATIHPDQPFDNLGFFLLPLAFHDLPEGIQQVEAVREKVLECRDLAGFMRQSLDEYEEKGSMDHALVVLGSSRQELADELERARTGLESSFTNGKEWQTPLGSYFTPTPFGPQEKIAFVYPGAFGTYIGMGREIFYLFPQLYDVLAEITSDPSKTINEGVIFPPELNASLKEELQNELNGNPTEMISSGVCFSYLYTFILRDIFGVKPSSAFGYSLGENSMMFALGIWSQADGMRTSLEASSIFHDRVSGAQNAIREFWKLPVAGQADEKHALWANYVLMASPEKVREALQDEERVYLTHINAPRQVVIGGDGEACRRVAAALNCMHLQAPYHHAIHCAPVASEYDAFMRMHDWPVESEPDIPVYTAAKYAPLPYDSKGIAECFATMLTNPIDFPRLVNLAYEDGARIFIELGAGSNCSKWVEATLKGKPFAAWSINQNNVDDHVSILRLLARLISHRVALDLSGLKGIPQG